MWGRDYELVLSEKDLFAHAEGTLVETAFKVQFHKNTQTSK